MNANTARKPGETFAAEVITHKGEPSFRPIGVVDDPLVRGLESVHLLRPVPEEDARLIRPREVWQVEVVSTHILRNQDRQYRKDSKGHPMVRVEVKLIGKVRSFFSRGEWITVAKKDEQNEVILSRVPAERKEVFETDTGDGRKVPLEKIIANGEVVRERVAKELPTTSFFKEGRWVTVAKWGGEEIVVSAVPAIREEVPYMAPDYHAVYVVECIIVDTPKETTVVRERAHHEMTLAEYQSERYRVMQEFRGMDSELGFTHNRNFAEGYDPSNAYPEDLPERLYHLC